MIQGGSERLVDANGRVQLDASQSYMPDLPLEPDEELDFLWSCRTVVGTVRCRYNADNLLHNSHIRHLIARP